MNIVLVGATAVHQALVAATLYLGREIGPGFSLVEGFGDMARDRNGDPVLVGQDEMGNQVYAVGVGRRVDVGCRILYSFRQVMGIPESRLFIDRVFMPGEVLLWLAGRLDSVPLGRTLHRWLSRRAVERAIKSLQAQALRLKENVAGAAPD